MLLYALSLNFRHAVWEVITEVKGGRRSAKSVTRHEKIRKNSYVIYGDRHRGIMPVKSDVRSVEAGLDHKQLEADSGCNSYTEDFRKPVARQWHVPLFWYERSGAVDGGERGCLDGGVAFRDRGRRFASRTGHQAEDWSVARKKQQL